MEHYSHIVGTRAQKNNVFEKLKLRVSGLRMGSKQVFAQITFPLHILLDYLKALIAFYFHRFN